MLLTAVGHVPLLGRIFSSLQFSRLVMSDSLRPHESQHARPPVHHQLPESTQTHVHQVGDAIQPSHPLSPSPPAPNTSQNKGLLQWVNYSHEGRILLCNCYFLPKNMKRDSRLIILNIYSWGVPVSEWNRFKTNQNILFCIWGAAS